LVGLGRALPVGRRVDAGVNALARGLTDGLSGLWHMSLPPHERRAWYSQIFFVLCFQALLLLVSLLGGLSFLTPPSSWWLQGLTQGGLVLCTISLVLLTWRSVQAHRIETERETARAEAAEQKAASHDEFFSMAAHDLRTPITSLRGYVELLLRHVRRGRFDDLAVAERALLTIERQSIRLTRLVNDLLDLSRMENDQLAFEPVLVDLAKLLPALAKTFRAEHPDAKIRLVVQESALVEADTTRLEQVVANLIGNALKHSGSNVVDLAVVREGTEALLSVRDHGVGIPLELRSRIFERHFQGMATTSPTAGLGLGLYIAKEIVERHSGRITIEEPEDGGAAFVVHLPIATGDHDRVSAQPQPDSDSCAA
jgi:signal transduction histidine kinase